MRTVLATLFGILLAALVFAQDAPQQKAAGELTRQGPFGIYMTMTLDSLRALGEVSSEGGGTYVASVVPNPHPDFETYAVYTSKSHGVCKIVAIGRNISSSAYGEGIRSAFERYEELLSGRYGEGDRLDYLRAGSIWDEPRDWMMALRQEERVLRTLWLAPDGQTFDNHITALSLKASALSATAGYLVISYEFENFKPCREENRKEAATVF